MGTGPSKDAGTSPLAVSTELSGNWLLTAPSSVSSVLTSASEPQHIAEYDLEDGQRSAISK